MVWYDIKSKYLETCQDNLLLSAILKLWFAHNFDNVGYYTDKTNDHV